MANISFLSKDWQPHATYYRDCHSLLGFSHAAHWESDFFLILLTIEKSAMHWIYQLYFRIQYKRRDGGDFQSKTTFDKIGLDTFSRKLSWDFRILLNLCRVMAKAVTSFPLSLTGSLLWWVSGRVLHENYKWLVSSKCYNSIRGCQFCCNTIPALHAQLRSNLSSNYHQAENEKSPACFILNVPISYNNNLCTQE